MKKLYGLAVVVTLVALLLPTTALVAMEDSNMQTTEAQTTQTDSTKFEIDEDTASADYQKKLAERLAARKEALKTKLTKAEQNRLKTRCKAAQTAIIKITEKAKTVRTTREGVYDKVIERAKGVSTKLKDAGKDTTAIDANIKELEAMVATFKTDLQTLRQAAADVSNMDCVTDPTSFKSSLETLRTARQAVQDDAVKIRTYIKDHLKVTLETIRTSLGETKKEQAN